MSEESEHSAKRVQWIAGMPYVRRWEARREARRKRRASSEAGRQDYYGLPVIHGPHWKWLIVAYFFLGGISSASYIIASIVDLFGRKEDRQIVRVGRYLSLATLLPCPVLLILDLGRPERFLYMLRIVKLRSPMSLGTWGLTIFGGFCGLSAVKQAAHDGWLGWIEPFDRLLVRLPNRTLNWTGSVFAFFVAGYTGVLLAITAVPLWAKNYLMLGPLFLASAMSTAVSAITLILTFMRTTGDQTLRRLERLDSITLSVEIALLTAIYLYSGKVIRRPLRLGALGRLARGGFIGGIVLPMVLQSANAALRLRPSHALSRLASVLVLVGGFILRYVFVIGGRQSAADPEATFVFTRRLS